MVQVRESKIKAKVLSPSQGMGASTNGKVPWFEQAREMKFIGRRLCEKSSDFADPCWV